MPSDRRDTYQEVTDKIIALIESGAASGDDWIKPWAVAAGEGVPVNAVTHNHYRGVNVLMLWAVAMERGYSTNEWASYRQWQSRGVQVQGRPADWPKNQPYGTGIVFAKSFRRKPKDGVDDDRERDEDGKVTIRVMRWSTVFNADQVDGYEPETQLDGLSEPERIEICDRHLEGTGAKIRHAGARAYYSPLDDAITLPDAERFRGDDWALYSVAFHELTHWSGASARLDRKLTGEKAKSEYAFEELIAELGSAFQCARLGIEPQAREDHAEYVAHWLRGMKQDKTAIVTAASKASDAADYLLSLSGVLNDQKEEVTA